MVVHTGKNDHDSINIERGLGGRVVLVVPIGSQSTQRLCVRIPLMWMHSTPIAIKNTKNQKSNQINSED